MPLQPIGQSRHEIEAKLKQLHDVPVNTAGSQDSDMLPLHASLMRVQPSSDGVLHWFCPRTESLTRELATFLLRLHAYRNEKVDEWRERMKKVWRGCADCIRCMDEAENTSRLTYFGAFSDNTLSRFWIDFEKYEVQTIIEALTEANVTPDSHKSLADVSTPLFYHILSKPTALGEPFILRVISSQPFLLLPTDWPMEPPPPGYFLLVVHEDKSIRDWAVEHVAKAKPIPREKFERNHELMLKILLVQLSGKNASDVSVVGAEPLSAPGREIGAVFPFSNSQRDIWAGFSSLLHLIPTEMYDSLGLHRIIMGHLHDNAPHFREVLRCLLQALKKLSNELWTGESADYPQVIFDAIKDNPSYTNLILSHDAQKEQPWFLFLIMEYLRSIWDTPIFADVLAKFVAFTCDEMQHERFEKKGPYVMSIAMQIVSAALTRANKLKSSFHRQTLMNVLDIHYDFIVAVCFSSEYTGSHWSIARLRALNLIQNILTSDIEHLVDAAVKLAALDPTIGSEDVRELAPVVRRQIWWKLYTNITRKDVEGMAMLLELSARTAKLDKLPKKVVSRTIWKHHEAMKAKPPQDLLEAVDIAVDAVNASLTIIRDGFLNAVTKFASHNSSSVLATLIQEKDLAKHLIFLMLSPVEDLHIAALTLIGQAYDVDVRADCFRGVLKAQPESSFDGLHRYISDFNTYALEVTEACNVSKALVRCMTDILDVLGDAPDGLLKDRKYIKRNTTDNFSLNNQLPKLWKAMTTSIAVIFKRTPKWAVHFDNNTMTEWMRDALIFARDLLEYRRTFEAASLGLPDEDIMGSPSKISPAGRKMIEDLQDVLLQLQAWLRLTDTELLYQSFALLKILFQCLRTAEVKPSPEALAKLSRFIELNKASKDSKRISFLNKADLAELEVAVADFTEENEDDVEIISVSWRPKGKRKSSDRISSPEVEEPEKQVVRKKQKTEKERVPDSSNAIRASLKQMKLSFSGKSSLNSLPKKAPQKLSEPVVKPTQISSKREPKFEGSLGNRAATSKPSRPAPPSSSSSSSESEESDGEGMSYIMTSPKKPTPKEVKPPVARRQIQVIEDPALRQAHLDQKERLRRQEQARRAALRLKPDITSLHLAILSWNYDHEGSDPPMKLPVLSRVPDSFNNPTEYLQIFRPLLMLEAWAQIVKSKEDATSQIFLVGINARSLQHPWLDLEVTLATEPGLDWHLNPETDIVLLRHASETRSLMAKVMTFRRGREGISLGLRCCTNSLPADPGLYVGSKWRLNHVFSLTTLHREYAALMALPYYDMVDTILRPSLSDPVAASVRETQQTMEAYRVNEPQARAIISAMNTKGFSLIQGPPGTGKTSTICALVGAFLSSRHTAPTRITLPGTVDRQSDKSPAQKLLICAPSNAAVDEIVKRLVGGVFGSKGQRLTPKVVRVGAESQINVSAKELSLDYLVDAKLGEEGSMVSGDAASEAKSLRAEIEDVKANRQKRMDELRSTVNNASRVRSLQSEIDSLNAKRMVLSQKLDGLQDKMKSQSRSNDALRRKYRYEILAEADIICSTLSGAGHEQLEPFDFSMVIIDEASQSIELSSLIPLKYQCNRCIMVGDPQQLPPTVLSPEASKWGYDQSLFVRMMKHRPDAIHLLSIQYRMHPEISLLPSKVFYGGRLQDGPDMDKKTAQPWHVDPRFCPYRFYSVENGREEPGRIAHSLLNRDECRMVLTFYNQLLKHFPSIDFDYRVGIVTMYRSQVVELRNMFRRQFGPEILKTVDFNTVDGFQGQEKDIIILSCVRAGPSLSTVGFLSDIRRMNVAITRSRSSLFIFGHAPTLQRSNKFWKDIIDDARSRSCFVELRDTSYFIGSSSQQMSQTEHDQSTLGILGAASKRTKQVKGTSKAEPIIPEAGNSSAPRKLAKDAKAVERTTNGIAASVSPVEEGQITEHDEKPKSEPFSPVPVNDLAPRKLPKGAKVVERPSNASAAPSSLSQVAQKPGSNEILVLRPQSNEKQAKTTDKVDPNQSSSRTEDPPQTAQRSVKLDRPDMASDRRAQKELEIYLRRKKEPPNPFIKR